MPNNFLSDDDAELHVVNYDIDPEFLGKPGKVGPGGKAEVKEPAEGEEEDDTQEGDEGKSKPKEKEKSKGAPTINLSDSDFDELVLKKGLKAGQKEEGKTKDDEEDPEDKDEDDKKLDPTNTFVAHYNTMVEAGLWREMEGFDGTEESYRKAMEFNRDEDANDLVEGILDNAFNKNPEGKKWGKALINHLAAGGKISTFQTVYGAADIDVKKLDDEDEDVAGATAEELLIDYYTRVGWKKEKITTKIAALKKAGDIIEAGKEVAEPWSELTTQQKATLENQQKQADKTRKENQRKYVTGISTLLEKTPKLGSIVVYKDKKEKQEAENYLLTPASADVAKSQFSLDLEEALKDPAATLFLATALRNGWHKNPEKLVVDPKKIKDETVSSLKDKLESSLLNKKDKDKNSKNPHLESSSNSKHKFNLDDAVVLT